MARRKRLQPPIAAQTETVSAQTAPAPMRAPIAQVAGDAAAAAAFHDVADELARAREDGRLVLRLPLERIEAAYLARDRMAPADAIADDEAMAALRASLTARGQQTPVEVVALGQERYGLVSGWRRVQALRALFEETGEARFGAVLALLRSPEDAAAAYVAMVEENEIRADLSFFERARIVRRAVEARAFADEQAALTGLFGSVSKSKRSKIKSFLAIVDRLGVLRHPVRISEHLGLKLVKALEADPELPSRVSRAVAALDPGDADAEIAVLQTLVSHAKPSPKTGKETAETEPNGPIDTHFRPVIAGLGIKVDRGVITLKGKRVTPKFAERLEAWLAEMERRG
ncbi:ParB N-terminal domain-containing protein [Cognatishimia sp. F0-27]|uniref:ParB/RepB/Spo0J family partition protein n=1 Tax=Cognatishimia sp. F0-27 TaxID=2816855 RepID=UPI001D0C45B6|nr:ParB N-terminal domain-containing protein [Cognatishimia sp. F0-27]MCC1494744.1 ParB N-terminal domain-containing protein [Cognatishimia sp. F0-27]